MTTAKFNSTSTENYAEADIKCTERTTRVDLLQIKDSANGLLGKGVAFAWAFKFALHGLKLKASDSVSYKSKSMTAEEFQKIIRSKANFCTEAQIKDVDGKGLGKDSDKRSVTAIRLVKAFAADLIKFIGKGGKVPEELSSLAEEAGLPLHYAFLNAGYGMTDDEFQARAGELYTFAALFDAQIKEAKDAGHLVGFALHSHAKDFVNYAKWRGVILSLPDAEPAEPKVVKVAGPAKTTK